MMQPTQARLCKLIKILELGASKIPFREPRAAVYAYLAFHYISGGQISRLLALSNHLKPTLNDITLPIQIRLLTHAMLGLNYLMSGDKSVRELLDAGLFIANHGESFYSTVFAYRIYCDALELNVVEAKNQLTVFLEHIPSGQRMDLSHHDFMLAWVSALESNFGGRS